MVGFIVYIESQYHSIIGKFRLNLSFGLGRWGVTELSWLVDQGCVDRLMTCIPVLPGDVHRGRCQVLSGRAGSGVGPSSLTGNRVPRSETRKVSALKVCPGSVPYNSMWYFRYTCGVRNYFKICEITWLTCFRGILCFCWKFNFYQDICAVHIDSLFYLYFL